MEEPYAAAVARLEEGLRNLEARVEAVSLDLRDFRNGLVSRLLWAIVVLALALGGKDVLQAVL